MASISRGPWKSWKQRLVCGPLDMRTCGSPYSQTRAYDSLSTTGSRLWLCLEYPGLRLGSWLGWYHYVGSTMEI